MKFHSTRSLDLVTLEQAVLRGLAPDLGLYMPEHIHRMPDSFFKQLPELSFPEMSRRVAQQLLADSIPSDHLDSIVSDAITFDAPLVEVSPGLFSLELFHGPTLAFKDFGARFLAGLLGYFARQRGLQVNILVATSGDTGGAVANGFLNTPGIRVVVLYPKGRVSELQEKQFTTAGGNITALAVEGTFDDCQRLVKQAFADRSLTDRMFLASANSINVARLIPQVFYYFRALSQLASTDPVVISVPSGNFGNLTAGLMARKLGLPIHHFIASTNLNDAVPRFLDTGTYAPKPGIATISNAMDVGSPNNFERLQALLGKDSEDWRNVVSAWSFSDEQTMSVMREVFATSGYVLDPHGAIGYLGLMRWRSENTRTNTGIFLETAHPAKFSDAVEEVIGQPVEIPDALLCLRNRTSYEIPMSPEFEVFRDWLMRNAG